MKQKRRKGPLPSILNDVIFHYIFASESNTRCLKILVNTVLEAGARPLAEDIQVRTPFNLANYHKGKQSVLDIRARSADGRWFNVEIQNAHPMGFFPRTLYYWAQTYSRQIDEGEPYTNLDPTIGIHLMDFSLANPPWPLHAKIELRLIDDLPRPLTDHLALDYLDFAQLRQLPPGDILSSKVYSLMYFLLHESDQEDALVAQITKKHPELKEIESSYLSAIKDDKIWSAADQQQKMLRDEIATRQYAEEVGWKKGQTEGTEQERERIIQTMKEQGLDPETIAQLVGLTTAEVQALL